MTDAASMLLASDAVPRYRESISERVGTDGGADGAGSKYGGVGSENGGERSENGDRRRRPDDGGGGGVVAAAEAEWRRFVLERHGDVFSTADSAPSPSAPSPPVARDLFVETLSFDFLLSELLAAAERTFDVALPTRPGENAAVRFAPDFDAVHGAVASDLPTATRERLGDAAEEFVRTATPADVATLHREAMSRLGRRAFGRYDTPPGLAELAVEAVAGDDSCDVVAGDHARATADATTPFEFANATVLDPGCGAGAFLAAAAERKRAAFADRDPAAAASRIAATVRGFDLNPTAVRASRLSVVLALRPLLSAAEGSLALDLRIVLGDAIDATEAGPPLSGDRADVLLGNPPWLTWDSLTERLKARWREGPMADADLDLFCHRGRNARLGHANDDVSVPFAWTCVHRLLRDGGRAAFVLKRDLLTGPAGELLRRRRVGDRPLRMRTVHDFGTLAPFGSEVDAGTALYRLDVGASDPAAAEDGGSDAGGARANGAPDGVEIPAVRWARRSEGTGDDVGGDDGNEDDVGGDGGGEDDTAGGPPRTRRRASPSFASLAAMRRTLDRRETAYVPVDPGEPSGPWVRTDAERRALGPADYGIRHGVKDDAKAVYGLDRETIRARGLEPDHVYPYLKSKHVVKYGLFGYDLHLVPQRRAGEENEAAVREETPNTYAYLDDHRERLDERGSSWFDGGPFYALFGLGPYTWADYKVVWCRLGFKPHFAVVSTVDDPELGEKPVVPGDHCMFVATDDRAEAHYLCALLNSAPYQRCLRDVSSGGKSSLSKSTVSKLSLPAWEATPSQRGLAEASMRAHDIVPDHVDCSKRAYNAKTIPELDAVQATIDRGVERFLANRDPGGRR
jgi:hypothetical protein